MYIFFLICNNCLVNELICEFILIFKEDYVFFCFFVLELYMLNIVKYKNLCILCFVILCRKGILFGWLKYIFFKLFLYVEKYCFKIINILEKVRFVFFL